MLVAPPPGPLPPPQGTLELNALKRATSTTNFLLFPSGKSFDPRRFTICRLGPRCAPNGSTGIVMLPELGSDGPPAGSLTPNSTVRRPGPPRYACKSVDPTIPNGNL